MIADPGRHTASAYDVAIAGGGIAGIAAALVIAQAGRRVLLLESRRKLGGRATSHLDQQTGQLIDNCQHVAMGCCTNYLDLCERLGVGEKIEWHEAVHWIEPGGRTSVMKPAPLPAPGHFGPSLAGAAFLTTFEKAAMTRGMLAALRADRRRWAERTFAHWLDKHRQPTRLIERFWEPVMVSACNLSVKTVCARTALHVIQEGFLASRRSSALGVSTVPLVELYDRAEEVIAQAGGAVRLGASVLELGEHSLSLAGGETIQADRIISALPPERLAKVAGDELRRRDPRLADLERVQHSPIVGVHLRFDRPVMCTPNAVLVGCGTQWLFRKDDEGRAVHAVISAADEWVGLDERAILDRVLRDVRRCLPWSADAKLEWGRAIKEKRATFAPTPEVEALRPSVTGSTDLILAGDFVQTGWPATMEGATRSGYAAAAAVLEQHPRDLIRRSLTPAVAIRTLAGPILRNQHQAVIH